MNFAQLSFGYFALKVYGVFLAIAFVIAAWRYYKRIQAAQLSVDFFVHHFWRWLVVGLGVGRLLSLVLDPSLFGRHDGVFALFAFWDGGMHWYGVMAGFLGMMWYDLRKHNHPFWPWADAGVIPFYLGLLFVDVAGFVTGALYGSETTMPWGVQYETFGVEILTPVHPVTLYAFVAHLWIYRWFLRHGKTLERTPGRLAIRGARLFFATDFVLQFFRGDATVMLFEVVRLEQVLDVLALVGLWWLEKGKKK